MLLCTIVQESMLGPLPCNHVYLYPWCTCNTVNLSHSNILPARPVRAAQERAVTVHLTNQIRVHKKRAHLNQIEQTRESATFFTNRAAIKLYHVRVGLGSAVLRWTSSSNIKVVCWLESGCSWVGVDRDRWSWHRWLPSFVRSSTENENDENLESEKKGKKPCTGSWKTHLQSVVGKM